MQYRSIEDVSIIEPTKIEAGRCTFHPLSDVTAPCIPRMALLHHSVAAALAMHGWSGLAVQSLCMKSVSISVGSSI